MSAASTQGCILVIGKDGQLARALGRIGSISGLPVVRMGRPEFDLTQLESIAPAVLAAKPAVVVNAAAYTAVERAESERELAFAINAEAVERLARACADKGIPFITLSTDYVFDGNKRAPYVEDDPVCPVNVYGASKAEGEDRVRRVLDQHLILRTSWVYSWHGRNFLLAMADRIANGAETKVVTDQTGSPTYAEDIAGAISKAVETIMSGANTNPWGTYHITNAGTTNWFGFAKEVFSLYAKMGHKTPPLLPVLSADFPTKAKRPAYSVLDTTLIGRRLAIAMPPWQDGVARCVKQLWEVGK
jgi:dTDP-4-dehydrorhamnose reductase